MTTFSQTDETLVFATDTTKGDLVEASVALASLSSLQGGSVGSRTVTAVDVIFDDDIVQHDTDYVTFTAQVRDLSGGAPVTLASKTTKITGGGAVSAFEPFDLGTITNGSNLGANKQITFEAVSSGAGQPWTNGKVRVTYSYTGFGPFDVLAALVRLIVAWAVGNINDNDWPLIARGSAAPLARAVDGIHHTTDTTAAQFSTLVAASQDAPVLPKWLEGGEYLPNAVLDT